jgi:D-alanyl-D-alanine carboxypeptidase (penicillin-binding protein 5/6)
MMRRFLTLLLLWPFFLLAQVPTPPELAVKSYILVDVTAGQTLASMKADEPVEPASLTKLMTAYLVFEALKTNKISLQQTMPVSIRAWKMTGSRMFIDPKMKIPVEDLIKGMIVQSGNDATVVLAEAVGGSVEHFVELMNQQAKAMGLNNTNYKNPEGLTEPGHSTTASDLSKLAQRLMQDFPEYIHYYSIKKYHYPGTPVANENNRNLLLYRDPTVDGLKTGHTDAAGYCLVATAQREVPGIKSRRLLSIVLGASSDISRAQESQKLLNWGYSAFDAIKLFDANQSIIEPVVWKGKNNKVSLGRFEPIVIAVPAGQGNKIKTEVVRPEPLVAPFSKGQTVARLKIRLGEEVVAEKPLLALAPVEESGVVGRAWDAIRLWIK